MILQLTEEGRLRLGDPVKTYLDRVPRGGKITIRMLLNHTSGIPSFPPGVENAAVEQPHRHWRPAQVAFRGLRQKRLSPPGAQWHYSNINYILLGEIAEELSDQSMASLFRDRVIGPLALEHTTFRPNAALPPGTLHGYFLESPAEAFLDTFGWNYSWLFTAGAMVSTLSDLHRYAPALATGEGLLSERMQRRRLRFVATGTGLEYGLGIFEIPARRHRDTALPRPQRDHLRL